MVEWTSPALTLRRSRCISCFSAGVHLHNRLSTVVVFDHYGCDAQQKPVLEQHLLDIARSVLRTADSILMDTSYAFCIRQQMEGDLIAESLVRVVSQNERIDPDSMTCISPATRMLFWPL